MLLVFSNLAFATITVPLNTGYDHWWGTTYGTAPSPTGLPKQDDYWMNVSTGATPAFAITKHPAWQNPLGISTWINAQNSWASITGRQYYIYRKCFCLQQGYKGPVIKFQIRADDGVTAWLNTITNVVLSPTGGSFSGPPVNAASDKGFKVGSNCLYVLVDDVGSVATGFNLDGNVSAAAGLLSTPAKGPNQSYAPCSCGSGPAGAAMRMEAGAGDDNDVIKSIREFAERRFKTVDPSIKRN
jgi:hypothetical protein